MNIRSTEPMAVRRADVRAAVAEQNRRARARASRWRRFLSACYAIAILGTCAALWSMIAGHLAVAGAGFGLGVLALLAADTASGMGAG